MRKFLACLCSISVALSPLSAFAEIEVDPLEPVEITGSGGVGLGGGGVGGSGGGGAGGISMEIPIANEPTDYAADPPKCATSVQGVTVRSNSLEIERHQAAVAAFHRHTAATGSYPPRGSLFNVMYADGSTQIWQVGAALHPQFALDPKPISPPSPPDPSAATKCSGG
jgi:hypothetical protein